MSLIHLSTELRQELKLTPQLLQSMELLQMNSQELLDYLQSGKLIPEVDGKHIGINNAIQRIRLIYGDAAKITLSNHSDGAQVEIWIPM